MRGGGERWCGWGRWDSREWQQAAADSPMPVPTNGSHKGRLQQQPNIAMVMPVKGDRTKAGVKASKAAAPHHPHARPHTAAAATTGWRPAGVGDCMLRRESLTTSCGPMRPSAPPGPAPGALAHVIWTSLRLPGSTACGLCAHKRPMRWHLGPGARAALHRGAVAATAGEQRRAPPSRVISLDQCPRPLEHPRPRCAAAQKRETSVPDATAAGPAAEQCRALPHCTWRPSQAHGDMQGEGARASVAFWHVSTQAWAKRGRVKPFPGILHSIRVTAASPTMRLCALALRQGWAARTQALGAEAVACTSPQGHLGWLLAAGYQERALQASCEYRPPVWLPCCLPETLQRVLQCQC